MQPVCYERTTKVVVAEYADRAVQVAKCWRHQRQGADAARRIPRRYKAMMRNATFLSHISFVLIEDNARLDDGGDCYDRSIKI